MKVCIFGMGYTGVISAACLMRDGHEVVGIDPAEGKVADLLRGHSPVQEPGLASLLRAAQARGRSSAKRRPEKGLFASDMVWVCVGTPSRPDGGADLSAVETAIAQIGRALHNSRQRPLIVVRSTCLPGTTESRTIPWLQRASGLKVGPDLDLVYHPEFLREGAGVEDFLRPQKIVVGEARPGAAERLLRIYRGKRAAVFRMSLTQAEMVKYWDNVYHALKVTFANEMGGIARAAGLDARKVAEVFCADTKLNISPKYLRPGPAFGGSCLPKDLRAILRLAAIKSLPVPMLEKVLQSNHSQINQLVRRILSHRPKTVGMVGLAFKPHTNDLRESPHLQVAEALLRRRIRLRIYDPPVQLGLTSGGSMQQLRRKLPHLRDLLVESLDDLAAGDLILVNHAVVDARRVLDWTKAGILVLDAAGVQDVDRRTAGYEGLYW